MAIPRKLLTALSKELDAYKGVASESAVNAVLAFLDQTGGVVSESDIPALRDVAIAAIEEAVDMCRADVVSVTMDAWDAATGASMSRRAQVVSESMEGMAHEYADRKVRWMVGEVNEGRMTAAQFVRACGDAADRGVNHAHLRAMQAASDRQGGKGRWARVPSGAETCPFCMMLASRSFAYLSAETAGAHYHANCDCRIVKGLPGKTHVEGYDPDALYEQWRDTETAKIVARGLRKPPDHAARLSPEGYADWREYCETPKRVRKQKQLSHILGTKQYMNELESRKGGRQSFFVMDYKEVEELVLNSLGKGEPMPNRTGGWSEMYTFTCKSVIGYDQRSGTFTRSFVVNCKAEDEVHAYPTFDLGYEPDDI